jgi:hypothetical protein
LQLWDAKTCEQRLEFAAMNPAGTMQVDSGPPMPLIDHCADKLQAVASAQNTYSVTTGEGNKANFETTLATPFELKRNPFWAASVGDVGP